MAIDIIQQAQGELAGYERAIAQLPQPASIEQAKEQIALLDQWARELNQRKRDLMARKKQIRVAREGDRLLVHTAAKGAAYVFPRERRGITGLSTQAGKLMRQGLEQQLLPFDVLITRVGAATVAANGKRRDRRSWLGVWARRPC